MKNIIKTIKIDIAGTEVEVTPQQAKDLHTALAGLLGLDKPDTVREVVRDRWYPYWPYATWTYKPLTVGSGTASWPDVNKWTVSYTANSQATVKVL